MPQSSANCELDNLNYYLKRVDVIATDTNGNKSTKRLSPIAARNKLLGLLWRKVFAGDKPDLRTAYKASLGCTVILSVKYSNGYMEHFRYIDKEGKSL